MPWRPSRGHWTTDGHTPVTSTQVAALLARLEAIADLRCRDVRLEADAVEVTPCYETAADAVFRFYRLRPVDAAAAGARFLPGLPQEWKSEPIPIPRHAHAGFDAGLAHMETEFAVRSFLCKVERNIDALLERAEERRRCWARCERETSLASAPEPASAESLPG